MLQAAIEEALSWPAPAVQLKALWEYLWRQHSEEGQAEKRLPSYRQLGQRLNISRERLPVLFALLWQIMPR